MQPFFSEEFWAQSLIYRDDDLIVLNKPSGIFTHRSPQSTEHYTLLVAMRELLGRYVYPLHRLDRATSGVLALALSPAAARMFSALFAERRIVKRYWAVVRGWSPDVGHIDRPLRKLEGTEMQAAQTTYRTLGRGTLPMPQGAFAGGRFSLVEVYPRTGRQHQIRRHLRGVDHPVLADSRHGDTHFNRYAREHLGISRLLLHATDLGFVDPRDGQWKRFHAPLDLAFAAVCEHFSWPAKPAPLEPASSPQT